MNPVSELRVFAGHCTPVWLSGRCKRKLCNPKENSNMCMAAQREASKMQASLLEPSPGFRKLKPDTK